MKGSPRTRQRRGISVDTVSPSPDDRPAGHPEPECPEGDEKGEENTEQASQLPWETTPGAARAAGAGFGLNEA